MVSCLTGMLVQFLHTTGSTPTAFRDKYKVSMSRTSWRFWGASPLETCGVAEPRHVTTPARMQLQETLKVVEHLQQREDGFRKKLKVRSWLAHARV